MNFTDDKGTSCFQIILDLFILGKKIPLVHTTSRAIICHRYVSTTHQLHFLLKYMHKVANEVDGERLQKFGPDRTCAEWILRNGGRIRFMEEQEWLSDYNLLPEEEDSHLFHVKDIDASGADVMFNGFLHLDGIKHLESMKIHDCRYVCDGCMFLLTRVCNSLRRLQISSCNEITDDGMNRLLSFRLLEELYLKDLPSVKDKKKVLEELKRFLPNCSIVYPDAEELTSHTKT